MKKKFTLLALVLIGCFSMAVAQKNDRHERIKALKVAFITEKLNLTSQEAQQFWPIYNAYEEATFKLKNVEMRKIRREVGQTGLDNMTDAKAEQLLSRIEEIESKVFAQRKKLSTDLRKVIPAKKILQLKKVEDDFNREILKKVREKRKKRMGGH